MKVIRQINEIREELVGKDNVGLVPTMGYLHDGHLSLVKKALSENKTVVVSIFVNPTQFAPDEDYDEYPRNFDRDKKVLTDMGVDYIFAPGANEMYPEGYKSYIDVQKLDDYLCGVSRPHFFRGVSTIVSKLFNIIEPDRAYFGQKDYQQYVIISRMVKDLNFPIDIRRVPIVREEDGLAMSSRNKYLSNEERESATILYRSLCRGKELIKQGERDVDKIKNIMENMIKKEETASIDYVSIADLDTLEPVKAINDGVLLAEAVFMGDTRLIDNMVVELK